MHEERETRVIEEASSAVVRPSALNIRRERPPRPGPKPEPDPRPPDPGPLPDTEPGETPPPVT